MLVLSRKLNETICIGNEITVKVMRINGGRVRIAIDAPDHIRIHRGELVAEVPTPRRSEAPETIAVELQQAT